MVRILSHKAEHTTCVNRCLGNSSNAIYKTIMFYYLQCFIMTLKLSFIAVL